ncbi:MAG: VanZ family protein [Coriobacteriia bacterium]|nr:VanZ family protein [Coriobacteriia bacterium]
MAEPSNAGAPRGASISPVAWLVAALAWTCFIWGHSLVPGTQSSQESGAVYAVLQPLFSLLGIVDASLCTFLIRKAAHVSEYAVLGLLAALLGRSLAVGGGGGPRLRRRAPVLFALVPVVDEGIQLFVPGRTGQPRDVLIDLCGMLLGAGIATVVAKLRPKA